MVLSTPECPHLWCLAMNCSLICRILGMYTLSCHVTSPPSRTIHPSSLFSIAFLTFSSHILRWTFLNLFSILCNSSPSSHILTNSLSFSIVVPSLSVSPRLWSTRQDSASALVLAFPGRCFNTKLYSCKSSTHLACLWLMFCGFWKYRNNRKAKKLSYTLNPYIPLICTALFLP